jgi:dTMP kinase
MITSYLERTRELDDHAVHLLFSANRWERRDAILQALRDGNHVICDRYAFSGAAFTAAKGLDLDWCKRCDSGLPQPDVVLFMHLSVDAASARGGFGLERYEEAGFQTKVHSQFDVLAREANAACPGLWQAIDGSGSVEEVHERVWRAAETAVVASVGQPVQSLWS